MADFGSPVVETVMQSAIQPSGSPIVEGVMNSPGGFGSTTAEVEMQAGVAPAIGGIKRSHRPHRNRRFNLLGPIKDQPV